MIWSYFRSFIMVYKITNHVFVMISIIFCSTTILFRNCNFDVSSVVVLTRSCCRLMLTRIGTFTFCSGHFRCWCRRSLRTSWMRWWMNLIGRWLEKLCLLKRRESSGILSTSSLIYGLRSALLMSSRTSIEYFVIFTVYRVSMGPDKSWQVLNLGVFISQDLNSPGGGLA